MSNCEKILHNFFQMQHRGWKENYVIHHETVFWEVRKQTKGTSKCHKTQMTHTIKATAIRWQNVEKIFKQWKQQCEKVMNNTTIPQPLYLMYFVLSKFCYSLIQHQILLLCDYNFLCSILRLVHYIVSK